MRRIFVSPENIKAGIITLKGEPLKKVRAVLRLNMGDALWVFDGSGYEYFSQIISLTSHEAELRILKKDNPVRESPIEIHLGQALPKANKMNFIIQKAVELGVSEIHPFYSSRTLPLYNEGQLISRLRRWQKISQEASQQSGRNQIPAVNQPKDFSTLLKLAPEESLKIILQKKSSENSLKNIMQIESKKKHIFFLVGPEGGFTQEEISLSLNFGFRPISLGERILRTETAAITLLSIIQYEWGDVC